MSVNNVNAVFVYLLQKKWNNSSKVIQFEDFSYFSIEIKNNQWDKTRAIYSLQWYSSKYKHARRNA